MKSKKGVEFAIGTIVVIVLALIVLVLLALGFTSGWGNLWNRVTDIFSSANVDSIRQGCSVACSTGAKYDYCSLARDVIFKDPTTGKLVSIYTMKGKSDSDPTSGPKTCLQLETISNTALKIDKCQIDCEGSQGEETKTCQLKPNTCSEFNINACASKIGCKLSDDGESCVDAADECGGLQGDACKDACALK